MRISDWSSDVCSSDLVDKYVYANVALKKAGLLRAAGPSISDCAAFVGSQGGIAFVYVTDPARRAELGPKLRQIFENTEGIAQVLDAATEAQIGRAHV